MSRGRIVRYLLLPVLVGLAVTVLVAFYIRVPAGQAESGPRVPVVVATRPVPAQTRLEADMLAVRQVPADLVGRGAIGRLEDAVGKVTKVPLAEGEFVLASKLARGDGTDGLAYRLPEGTRALTVAADPVIAVGGFVQPGDRVDVFIGLPGGQPGVAQPEVRLLVENVLVLAVQQQTAAEGQPAGEGLTHLTLAVSPAHAAAIVLAEQEGRLRLALRPAGDDTPAGPITARLADLAR
ncbi:Flp pilus assembly protein CpaB [Thermaerobacter marianensis DSM 12885]|uniref:Flp pilus assembly protein CpaB n=1 Tax=Thermaerobacter marianensis (strain ATCC 700841 / DSM 12885 / JCM 10246 / 7p75a) TaxID=644966 RepID=E6SL92_THEM7|nr:Flp pilus assembly protein CpaB [Thermaerobacter marianensis]ADU51323.1 Flp pilus assembly protein CpaB [Thermaerobacter marianensis DSM 12885]